jgi:hypothetical protein
MQPARKADNLTVILEPTFQKLWYARRLKTVWASTVCQWDNFTTLYVDDVRASQGTQMCLHDLLLG